MSSWSIPPLLMASINAYVAVHYLVLYFRTRHARELLSFPFLALAVGVYDTACAFLYSAASPEAGRPWQIVKIVTLTLGAIALVVFVAHYTRRKPGRFVTVICVAYGALLAAPLVGGLGLVVTNAPQVRFIELPLGVDVTYQEMALGPLAPLLNLVSLGVIVYTFAAGAAQFRAGERLRARRLLAATGLLFAAAVNDALLALGLITSFYMIEYAFMGMVILMAASLSKELTRIAGMDQALRQSERNYREVFDSAGDAISLYDPKTTAVLDVNQAMLDMFGYTREEALRLGAEELSGRGAQFTSEAAAARIRMAIEEGPQAFEWRARRKDGTEFWVEVMLRSSLIGGQGRVLIAVRDITARKAAEEALRESESELRTLTNMTTTGIVIHAGAELLWANAAAARATGYSTQELLTMKFWELIHPDMRDLVRARGVARVAGSADLPSSYEIKLLTKDRKVRWVSLTAGVFARKGQPALVATLYDITEERRLRELQAALYEISEATSTSPSLDDLFGSIHRIVGRLMDARNFYIALYDPAVNLVSFPYFVDEADTPDPPRRPQRGLTEYVLRTGKPLLATPQVFDDLCGRGEVELVGAPSLDWLGVPLVVGDQTLGVVVVQSYGEEVRYGEKEKEILAFVSRQVALAIERKRSEEALRRHTAQLEALREVSLGIAAELDLAGLLRTITERALTLLGADAGELFLHRPERDDLELTVNVGAGEAKAGAALRRGEGLAGRVWEDGRSLVVGRDAAGPTTADAGIAPTWGSAVAAPIRWGDLFLGVVGVGPPTPSPFGAAERELLDLFATQAAVAIVNARLFAEVEQLAVVDELTRLFNRRGLLTLGAREVERARRFGHPLTALFIDLDHFKELNDRFSHRVGDAVLREVSAKILGSVREIDVAARFGGEEFVVLLVETDLAGAREVADRIRQEVEAVTLATEQGPARVTVSIGVVALRPDAADLDQLVHHADEAMYAAKLAGRNRVVLRTE